MFKSFFINLTNIASEISLLYLYEGKEYPKLNEITVKIYHLLYKRK